MESRYGNSIFDLKNNERVFDELRMTIAEMLERMKYGDNYNPTEKKVEPNMFLKPEAVSVERFKSMDFGMRYRKLLRIFEVTDATVIN